MRVTEHVHAIKVPFAVSTRFVYAYLIYGKQICLVDSGIAPAKEKIFLPRFRDVVNYIQFPDVDLEKKFAEVKGEKLTAGELAILKEREKYAKIWLEEYAPEEAKFRVASSERAAKTRGKLPAEFYQELIGKVEGTASPEELEKEIYALIKQSGSPAKAVFGEIYTLLINKAYGPKLAWLIWENKDKSLKLLKEAAK